MKNSEAKERLANGQDRSLVMRAYIEDKIKAVNYEAKGKRIAFVDIRKDIEKPFIKMKAELDWLYYVIDEITKEQHTGLSNAIDEEMQIAIYNENEIHGNKYPKFKEMMEREKDGIKHIDKLKSIHEARHGDC